MICGVLQKQLEAWSITPTELLHCWSHSKRFQDSGTLMQGAVQQASIAMAKALNAKAPVLMKQIYNAIDEASLRLRQETGAAQSAPARIRDILAGLRESSPDDRQRRVLNAICERLRESADWAEKVICLVHMLPADPNAEELAPVDTLVADILGTPSGLSMLLSVSQGTLPTTAANDPVRAAPEKKQRLQMVIIADLFELLLPKSANGKLPATIPGEFQRLLDLLRGGQLPESACEVINRIAQEVESARGLAGLSSDVSVVPEARAINQIARRIEEVEKRFKALCERTEEDDSGNRVANPLRQAITRIGEALDGRSESLLRPERVGTQLAAIEDVVSSITLLLELTAHITGELNRRRAGKLLLSKVSGEIAEARLLDVPDQQAFQHLKLLARWQATVTGGLVPDDMAEMISGSLDRLCLTLIERLNIFKTIAKQRPDPVDQALAIFDLVGNNLVTQGKAMASSRKRVLSCIRAAGGPEAFAQGLKAKNLGTERLTAFQGFLM